MLIGSVFSGIGGLELGLEMAGLGKTLWQVEIDDRCGAILEKHWPQSDQRISDVRQVRRGLLPPVDLICGGFPCQDVSGAGKGRGLAGDRSGLWYEYLRIVSEFKPRWVVVENVASGAKKYLCEVRSGLHELGYSTAAVALSAFDVGAPHRRKRIFVVAHDNSISFHVQSRGGEWSCGQGPTEPANDGEEGLASDADVMRELQPQRSEQEQWRWSRDGGGWTPQPPVYGMAHGVPYGVDRNRMLGNAVVPQCSVVIGRMIHAVEDGEPWDLVFS